MLHTILHTVLHTVLHIILLQLPGVELPAGVEQFPPVPPAALAVPPAGAGDGSLLWTNWLMGTLSTILSAAVAIAVQKFSREKRTAEQVLQEATAIVLAQEQFRAAMSKTTQSDPDPDQQPDQQPDKHG